MLFVLSSGYVAASRRPEEPSAALIPCRRVWGIWLPVSGAVFEWRVLVCRCWVVHCKHGVQQSDEASYSVCSLVGLIAIKPVMQSKDTGYDSNVARMMDGSE